jgi:hypothetical protein
MKTEFKCRTIKIIALTGYSPPVSPPAIFSVSVVSSHAVGTSYNLFVLTDNSKMKVDWILLTAWVSGTPIQHPVRETGITDSPMVV